MLLNYFKTMLNSAEKLFECGELFEMTLVKHTRKQDQMCAIAKAICEKNMKTNVGEQIYGPTKLLSTTYLASSVPSMSIAEINLSASIFL